MTCRHCAFDNAPDARFCENCGEPLDQPCPACGTPMSATARFCRNCGVKRAGTPPAVSAVAPAPVAPAPDRLSALRRAAPNALQEKILTGRAQIEGARKQVTVLFTDIVGSTTLAAHRDPEEWGEIVSGAHQRVSEAVYRYEGTIAQLLGDGVLAFFGAPMTHEDDPVRAVLAALDILAAIDAYGRDLARQQRSDRLQMRIGLQTGLVVVGTIGSDLHMEYLAIGDTVNLAARLQAAAEPDSILISANTARLVKHAFRLEARGPLELKGVTEPVPAFRVLERKPMPETARGLEGVRAPVIGRDIEIQQVYGQVAGLRAGTGALIAIMGDAGLGKSRLVAEVRQLIDADNQSSINWLEGRAISYGQAIAYYPWRQVIRQAIGAQEGETPEAVREKLSCSCDCCAMPGGDLPFLEALLAVESETTLKAIMGLAGNELAHHLTEAIRGYLCGHAQMAPTVVVFDDLHWADPASLELLLNASELVETWPLLIICLLRPDKDAPSWSVMQVLRDRLGARYTEIGLEPLDTERSRELLENLLDIQDLPERVRALILAKSEGNPFFLEEVLRSLIDSGHIVQENHHWRATREIATVALPDTLAGVLSARIDRLPDDTKRVAQTAAVLGRIFPYRALTMMSATAPPAERIEDIEPHLGTLTDEELVRERVRNPELEYIFKHALTQETAYDLLLLRRRKELHRRAGETLARLYPDRLDELAPVLAHHFWLGEDWAQAADYSRQAARRAAAVYALREALEHYAHTHEALEHLPDAPSDRIFEAILAWTWVAYKLRHHENVPQREEMLRRLARAEAIARALDDKARLAEALVWIGNVHLLSGYPGTAMQPLLESHKLSAELGDERLTVLALFMVTFGMVENDPRNAIDQLERVIELARKYASPEIEVHALASKAVAHARLGEFATARAGIDAALALLPAANSIIKEADVHLSAGAAYFEMGEIARGLEHTRYGVELSVRVEGYECACSGYLILGQGNLLVPDLARARDALDQSVKFFEVATAKGSANPGTVTHFEIYVRAGQAMADCTALKEGEAVGDAPRILADIERLILDARAIGENYTAAQLSQALIAPLVRLGEYDRAERHLNDALAFVRQHVMRPALERTLESAALLYNAQQRGQEAEQARAEARQLRRELELDR